MYQTDLLSLLEAEIVVKASPVLQAVPVHEALVPHYKPEPDELAEAAIRVIEELLKTEILAFGYSGGKDSTLIVILAMMAAKRVKAQGGIMAPIFVLSGDTEIENPAVSSLRDHHLDLLAKWAEEQGIEVITDVYRPQLNATWAVKVLSGSALPRYPTSKTSDCSVSWKVAPAEKALRTLMPELVARLEVEAQDKLPGHPAHEILARAKAHPHPITVLGSRFSESTSRAASMARHNQHASEVSTNEAGRRVLSPIANWDENDVWEIIALAGTSSTDYPVWMGDFGEIVELYKDAGGGQCVALGTDKQGKTACGARTGCWGCQAMAEDKSLTAMLENPKYAHMKRLNQIRDYIAALQFDWSRRIWTTRFISPETGYLRTGPDCFDDDTLDLLTVAVLSSDHAEALRAERFEQAVERGVVPKDLYLQESLGPAGSPIEKDKLTPETRRYLAKMGERQFQTFTPRHIVALDFYRSILNRGRPFHVIHLANKVWRDGYDMVLPAIDPLPRTPTPPYQWTPIERLENMPGIGDPLAVALEENMYGNATGEMVGDQIVPEHRLGPDFDVDEETACLVMDLEWTRS